MGPQQYPGLRSRLCGNEEVQLFYGRARDGDAHIVAGQRTKGFV